MKMKNNTYLTAVWLISLFVSIDVGNHALHFLENVGLNVWGARVAGVIVCILVGIIFYNLWIKKVNEK